MKKLKFKLTLYLNSLCDELRSLVNHRKNKPRTPRLKKLCSFVLAFSFLLYTFLGLFGCLKASAVDVESSQSLSGVWLFNSVLTNTNDFVTSEPTGIDISFISNSQEFDFMSLYGFGGIRLSYKFGDDEPLRVYDPGAFNDSYWRNESYRFVDFGSSVQTVSPQFYNWFISNAEPYSSDSVINDLAGYTITVPFGWTTTPGLIESVGVSGIITSYYGGDIPFSVLRLGYSSDEGYISPASNIVSFDNYNIDGYESNSGFTLSELTGNVTNSQFIQWLYDNNASFSGGDVPEVTYILSGSWIFNEVPSLPPSGSSIGERTLNFRINVDSSILNILDIDSTRIAYGYGQTLDGYLYYSGGWVDDYDRIITFEGEQTVGEEFYNWFTSNAIPYTPPVETYSLSGSWVFNERITLLDNVYFPVRFSSNNFSFDGVSFQNGGLGLNFNRDGGYTPVYENNTWNTQAYRTIIFDGTQSVSLDFYEWFIFNASPNTPLPSFSLEGLYFLSNTSISSSFEITFTRPFISNSEYYNTIYFTNAISGDMISYVDSNNNQVVVYSENSGWLDPQYSVILFNTPETVSGEDYSTFSSYYSSVSNDSNLNLLYTAGLENGRDFGFSEGYNEGYSVGFADGEASSLESSFMGDFFGGILDALDALTIFGNISVLDVIQGVLGLFIALWVLKLIAGG